MCDLLVCTLDVPELQKSCYQAQLRYLVNKEDPKLDQRDHDEKRKMDLEAEQDSCNVVGENKILEEALDDLRSQPEAKLNLLKGSEDEMMQQAAGDNLIRDKEFARKPADDVTIDMDDSSVEHDTEGERFADYTHDNLMRSVDGGNQNDSSKPMQIADPEPGVEDEATQATKKESLLVQPEWKEFKLLQYKTSHLVSPTEVVPCLVKIKDRALLVPMIWGFIPPKHKGTHPLNHGFYSTYSARGDGLLTSPLYQDAFRAGKRCAIICTGFYKFKVINNHSRQPFFFHLPQEEGVIISEKKKRLQNGSEYHVPRITPLAGVYHCWKNSKGDVFPNVTMVTMPSGKWLDWCHDTMPVILDTPDKIEKWLDDKVAPEEAVKMFVEPYSINWYPVTKDIKESRSSCPLQPIGVQATAELVPDFVSEWDRSDPEKEIEPPVPGQYKATMKIEKPSSSQSGDGPKKQSVLSWLREYNY